MPTLDPTPTEVLEERASDYALRRAKANHRLAQILSAGGIALRAVYEAAAAGNVRCKDAVKEIEEALR